MFTLVPSPFRQQMVYSLVFASGFFFVGIEGIFAQISGDPTPVVVGNVGQIRRAQSESFVGTFQALRKSTIGSAVEGRVITMGVMPGDSVAANQMMTQLRTETLEIEMKSADLQLKLSQQSLMELEASLPKEIEMAEAGVRESAARFQFSKTEYDRSRRLRGNANAISQGELELSRSQFLADQEAATSSKIEYNKLLSTKELRLTQAKLNMEVAIQEIKRLVDLKSKYTIKAPFESVVTQKLTDVGEWVTKGQAVVEVLQLDPIQLVVNAPQERLQMIQSSLSKSADGKPLSAEIRVEGIAEALSGTVKSIVSQADLRSRTFPVRIEIENQKVGDGYALQPGMLGRATLMVGAVNEMTVVKKDALVLGAGDKSVFKVSRRGAAKVAVEVPVQTGPAFGDWIQVIGDLSVDDQVVLFGNERLRTGDEIKISKTVDDLP